MNGALGISALFAGFAFLVYAAKGSHGTQWDGSIAPGPVLGQLFLGRWPYGQPVLDQGEGPVPIVPGVNADSYSPPPSSSSTRGVTA